MKGKRELDKALWPLVDGYRKEHGKYPEKISLSENEKERLGLYMYEGNRIINVFTVDHVTDIPIKVDPNQHEAYRLT